MYLSHADSAGLYATEFAMWKDNNTVAKTTPRYAKYALSSSSMLLDLRDPVYDRNTWYPCNITVPYVFGEIPRLSIFQGLDIYSYYDTSTNIVNNPMPSWMTHPKGISLILEIEFVGDNWGTHATSNNWFYNILNYTGYFGGETSFGGCEGVYQNSTFCLMLRGGGVYKYHTNFSGVLTGNPNGYTWTGSSSTKHIPAEPLPSTQSDINNLIYRNVKRPRTAYVRLSHRAEGLKTTRNIFGKPFDGTGNVAGQAYVYGSYSTNQTGYANGGIQLREQNLIGTAQTSDAYSPRIGFHWGGRFGYSIIANVGYFKFQAQNEVDNVKLIAKGFQKNDLDDTYVLLAGGGHKSLSELNSSHSHSEYLTSITKAQVEAVLTGDISSHVHSAYLPLSGGTMTGLLTAHINAPNSGIRLGDTYVSAIGGRVIFQNNTSIRFGGNAWDYDNWAGLKYDHANKTIYLGLADGTYFTRNASNQSGGSIKTPGISSIYVGADTKLATETWVTNKGYTTNTGTITGIIMNNVSKGTSGVVDLGTVITSHQSLDAYATKTWVENKNYLTSIPVATSSVIGGIKLGYSETGKKYAVKLDNNTAYVEVPWTDNNTTYTAGTNITIGADNKINCSYTYSHPTGDGNNHIPQGGSNGQILRWSSEGTASWGADNDTTNTAGATNYTGTLYIVGAKLQSLSAATGVQTYTNANVKIQSSAVYATNGFYESSDKRLKNVLSGLDFDLDSLNEISKIRFTRKNDESKKPKVEIGVIAQEVQKYFPEIVSSDENGILSVAYDKLAVVALAAIDKLYEEIKILKQQINEK